MRSQGRIPVMLSKAQYSGRLPSVKAPYLVVSGEAGRREVGCPTVRLMDGEFDICGSACVALPLASPCAVICTAERYCERIVKQQADRWSD